LAGFLLAPDALHDFARFFDLPLRFGFPQEFMNIHGDGAMVVYVPCSFLVIEIDKFP